MKNQHVELPNSMPTIFGYITPQDLVVYLSIKRHWKNNETPCYPSLNTISKESGASINKVRSCIKNLLQTGYMKYIPYKRGFWYKFYHCERFEKFSMEFLDKAELTFTERAYLTAVQQYVYKDSSTFKGDTYYNSIKLSQLINMPASTIRKCENSLVSKGFMEIQDTTMRNSETGCKIKKKIYDYTKLEQQVACINEKVRENTKNIDDIKKVLNIIYEESSPEVKEKIDKVLKM